MLDISSRLGHLDSTNLRAETCQQTISPANKHFTTIQAVCAAEVKIAGQADLAKHAASSPSAGFVRYTSDIHPIYIRYPLFFYTEDTSSGTYWLTYRRGTTVRLLASKSHLKPVFRTNMAAARP